MTRFKTSCTGVFESLPMNTDPYVNQIGHFAECIATGKEPLINGEEWYKDLAVCLAAYEASSPSMRAFGTMMDRAPRRSSDRISPQVMWRTCRGGDGIEPRSHAGKYRYIGLFGRPIPWSSNESPIWKKAFEKFEGKRASRCSLSRGNEALIWVRFQ